MGWVSQIDSETKTAVGPQGIKQVGADGIDQ